VELKIEVANASLDDVVAAVFDETGEEVGGVTLGDHVIEALLGKLAKDPRWDALGARFAEAVDQYFRDAAPGVVKAMVEQEVTRQLGDWSQGALTRGKPSTRAEAIVATEVTAQLRGQFTPIVERALTNLAADLMVLSGDAVDAFRKGTGR
jgi:hypothetical protein